MGGGEGRREEDISSGYIDGTAGSWKQKSTRRGGEGRGREEGREERREIGQLYEHHERTRGFTTPLAASRTGWAWPKKMGCDVRRK